LLDAHVQPDLLDAHVQPDLLDAHAQPDLLDAHIQRVVRGHRASQVVQSLEISESTIYRLLKSWRICGDTENISRTGRKQIVTKRAENTLSMVVKTSRRATLKDITA
jgi:transposase